MQVMQEAVLLVTYVIFLIKIVSNESKKKLNLVGYFFLLPILCHMEGVLIRFEFRWFGYRILGAELEIKKKKERHLSKITKLPIDSMRLSEQI